MQDSFIVNDFWNFEGSEGGQEIARINVPEFIKFLEVNGFGKIYLVGDKLKPTFIRIENNVCRIISRDTIITYGRSYVQYRVQDIQRLKKVFDAYIKSIVAKPESLYSMFSVKEIEFLTDKKASIYFYFKNEIVVVAADGLKQIQYANSPGIIWEDQIICHEIIVNLDEVYCTSSEFARFLLNISEAEDQKTHAERYRSIISITGYLIHEHRDLSKMKAVILMDSNLSATPEGGAGKGLFIQGITKVRNTVKEDGKNFEFKNKFMFQKVTPSTKIIFFDDVTRDFDFERLFSTITDGINVEYKHQRAFVIPAERSPRIVASTNYAILGHGGSFERRKIEFEFSDHYNRNHNPNIEFGHDFFTEWTEGEWNKFYNFLFYACNFYLKTGLIESPSINKELKLILHSTSSEFYEFAQEEIILNQEYKKKDLYEAFKQQYPDFINLKQRTFTSWLTSYAEIRGFRMMERKSGNNYYVIFVQ